MDNTREPSPCVLGCETIAIYNVLKKLGKNPYYPDILIECYINGLDWLGGTWGVNPQKIYKYFDAHSIDYYKTKNFNKWVKRLQKEGVGILSFWNEWHVFRGLHTVMIIYKNKKYYVYNAFDNFTEYEKFETLKELKDYMKGSFIIGYTF